MGKKIVVLNGSPRAKGNTATLVKAFAEGAVAAGHEVTCFDLQKMDIHPCLGCCGGVFQVGDIAGNEKLEEAYRLGNTI